jgi:hypothetical protein
MNGTRRGFQVVRTQREEPRGELPRNALVKVSGLWVTTNGHLSGNAGNAKYLVLKNDKKEKDTEPDYNLFVTSSYVPPEFRRDRDNGYGVHSPPAARSENRPRSS